ncbi:MAG: antibiotic biosynthesis monooxygenase [Acidimicrobiia bacterium]|nr:antibiotic biosynthesis monooxygenase [Acidimicrobiia bacterium]
MATILAHIRVHPGAESRFEGLARDLYSASHAHETGVREYQYWRGQEPGLYYTLLAFDDHQSFIAHQVSEHHEAAARALGEVIADIRLEWVDPVAGASPLPPTTGQGPPEGASPAVQAATERFAARVAPWWADQRSSS